MKDLFAALKNNFKNRKGLVYVHSAVILFGAAGLFGKLVTLSSFVIVFSRVLIASIVLLLLILSKKQKLKLSSRKDYFGLVIQGLLLSIHWYAFFHSIQLSSVAIGVLTYATFPVFVAFLEPLYFKEKFRLTDVLLALLTTIGVFIIIPHHHADTNMLYGILWGLLSGFTFALLSIRNRTYIHQYPGYLVTFYQFAVATIILLPFIVVIPIKMTGKDVFMLILLGIVFTALAHTLFVSGLRNISTRYASIIASMEPVYGVIFAILILGEIPGLNVIIGGIIILVSNVIYSMKSVQL